MTKIKDTDYLFITSVIRAKEPRLLKKAQLDRMIEAKTDDEAIRVLEECGFDDLSNVSAIELERILTEYFEQILTELVRFVPNPGLVDIFRLKYDYHNAKVIIKTEAAGTEAKHLMSGLGRYSPEVLEENYLKGGGGFVSSELSAAMQKAKEVLARTDDAQQADFLLDKAYYDEYCILAQDLGSDFIIRYCQLVIDTANLRAAVRAIRMDADPSVLEKALIEGGSVSPNTILTRNQSAESIAELFINGPLKQAAELVSGNLEEGGLTLFEKYCDNALLSYLQSAKMVSFGEAPVAAFISAVEAEITSVRIVMNSRRLNLGAETIRERLRDAYV